VLARNTSIFSSAAASGAPLAVRSLPFLRGLSRVALISSHPGAACASTAAAVA
jgi:hypothetical protein